MTPQLWATVAVAAVGVAMQVIGAWVVVRTALAVLNEKHNGHRESVAQRFVAVEAHLENTDSEVLRLRTRSHDHANAIQRHTEQIRQLEHVHKRS